MGFASGTVFCGNLVVVTVEPAARLVVFLFCVTVLSLLLVAGVELTGISTVVFAIVSWPIMSRVVWAFCCGGS